MEKEQLNNLETVIYKLFNCLAYPSASRAGSSLEYPFVKIAVALLELWKRR